MCVFQCVCDSPNSHLQRSNPECGCNCSEHCGGQSSFILTHLDQSEDRPRPHARSTRAQRKQAAAGTVQVRGVSSLVAAVASEWYWRAVCAWGSSCQTMHSLGPLVVGMLCFSAIACVGLCMCLPSISLVLCCLFDPVLFVWSCVVCLVLCCLFDPVLFVWSCVVCLVLCCLFGPVLFIWSYVV